MLGSLLWLECLTLFCFVFSPPLFLSNFSFWNCPVFPSLCLLVGFSPVLELDPLVFLGLALRISKVG